MSATQERVNGAIDSFYDEDTGAVSQDGQPTKHDFFHPGARVEFGQSALVNYLKITTPTGKVIVNDIKNGHR
jgi:hypothetical protein